ncbi:MAG: hypothetical protein IJS03_05680 [Eubacterium sp.]|nr:hypothetical protein [Eubacterium sp.]
MKVLLIILAVLVLIFVIILSLSAEFEVVFDDGWSTKVRVLWIEKDIELSKLLNFILFPEKAAQDTVDEMSSDKEEAKEKKDKKPEAPKEPEKADEKQPEPEKVEEEPFELHEPDENYHISDEELKKIIQQAAAEEAEDDTPTQEEKASKPNFLQKIWRDEGIVGIMLLVTNLLETVNSAITTLIKGLHIYSLYVKMIIGGGEAADIAEKYGALAGYYYPIKGIILNQMRVDEFDDYITADFIAPRSEYEFQIIGSINIALLLKIMLKAGKVFLINLIKNK